MQGRFRLPAATNGFYGCPKQQHAVEQSGGPVAARSQYEELARQLSAVGAVKRGLARTLPAECPGGSAAVLALLDQHGEMRISRLAELLAVDMSVTSRHVAHVAERGWIERSPDPADKRSRILRLTPRETTYSSI